MLGNLTDHEADVILKAQLDAEENNPESDLLDAITHGYAGMMPDGRIVDRRKTKGARPIATNATLGVGSPKDVSEV